MGVPDFLGYKIYCDAVLVLPGVRYVSPWLSHRFETVTLCPQGTVVSNALDTDRLLFFSLPYFHFHTLVPALQCFPSKIPTPTCTKYNSRIKNATSTCRKYNSGTNILHLHVESITHTSTSAYNIAKKDHLIYSLKVMYSMVLSFQSSGSFLVVG